MESYRRPALTRRPVSIGPRLAIRERPNPPEPIPARGRPPIKQAPILRTPRRSLSNSSDNSTVSSVAPTVGSQSEPVSPRLLPRKNSVRFRKPAANSIEFLNRPPQPEYPLIPYARYGPGPEDDEDTTSVSSEITSSSQTTSTDSDATSRVDDRRPAPTTLQRRSPSHPPPGILTRRNSNGDARSVSSRSVATQASSASRTPRQRPLTIEIHTPQAAPPPVQMPAADSTNNTQAIALRDEVEGVLLTRIKQLEDEMQDLQASKTDVAKQLDTALVQLSTAKIDSDEGEKQWAYERETLENQLVLAKQSMERQWGQERKSLEREFESERDELEAQLVVAKKNMSTSWGQEKLALERSWDRERQALLQDIQDREQDFHTQRRDYELVRRELDEQQRAVEEFRTRLSEQSQRLAVAESERDRLIDSQRILDELRSGFETRGTMLEMAEKDRDELRAERSDLRSKKLDLEAALRKLEEDLGVEKQVGTTLIAQIAALELTSAAAQGKADALNADRMRQIEEIMALTMERDGLKADVARLEAQVEALTTEKAAEKAELEAEKAAIEAEKVALGAEKAAVQARLAEVEVEVSTLKGEKELLIVKVDTLEAEVIVIKNQLSILESLKTDQQSLIDTLTANRDDLATQVGALKATTAEQDAEINSLRNASSDRSSDIAKLVEENKVLLQTNSELRSLPASVDTVELLDLRAKAEAQAAENTGLGEIKAALEDQLKEIETQKQTLRSTVEQLETANAAYRAESASLQTQLAQLKQQQQQQQRKQSTERTPKLTEKQKKNLHMVRDKQEPGTLSIKEVIRRSVREW